MMKKVQFSPSITWFCILCMLLLMACQKKSGEEKDHLYPDNDIIKNRICSVKCLDDTTQSYALYIPQTIVSLKDHQAIIFFDSHARGWIPVKKYQHVAEKYGAILIGSMNIKNRLPHDSLHSIFSCLTHDLLTRFGIGPTNITLAGFSGGGRIASILAEGNSRITSVLSCGAGLAKPGIEKPRVSYAFLGGQYDFNFAELIQVTHYLSNKRIKNQLFTFESGHEWPPMETFDEAILWLALKNAKTSHFKNIKTHFKEFLQNITSLEKQYIEQNDTIKLYELYQFIGEFLSPAKKGKAYIQKSQQYKYDNNYYINIENKKRQQYQQDFFDKDAIWWENEMNALMNNNESILEERVNRRVLSYISLLCYMHLSKIITTGDLENIQKFIKIYELADPVNPDVFIFKAKISLLKKNTAQSLQYLNKAVELDLDDINKLKEPAFERLKSTAEYNNILLEITKKRNISSCYVKQQK